MTAAKSNGCHIKATKMRRTSSRRNISVHPSQNGRCTYITENSKVRMSIYRDTSTTTQVAQIIVQHGRPVVPLEWNLYSHPLAGFLWERQFEKVLLEHGWENVSKLGMLICEQRKRTILVCVRGRHKISWKKQNIEPMWKVLMKQVDLGAPTSFLNMFIWSALNENAKRAKILRKITEICLNPGSLQKLPCSGKPDADIRTWFHDMEGNAKKCVKLYCELADKNTQQLYKVTTPCLDDHQFKEEVLGSVGELSNVCSQIVLKCLYLARIGRPDISWSISKFARTVTRWTGACDKRLVRLISCTHYTSHLKQYCHVGNTAQQCRLGLFQDSDFATTCKHHTTPAHTWNFSRGSRLICSFV